MCVWSQMRSCSDGGETFYDVDGGTLWGILRGSKNEGILEERFNLDAFFDTTR